jgi:hypothetical protein
MFSNDWKVLLIAPLAATLLTACQKNSDDPKDSPSSPYQGLWMSTNTDWELQQCRAHGGRMQVHDVDAIFIQGDGQVIRYLDKETFAKPEARAQMRIGQVQNNGQFNHQDTYNSWGGTLPDGMFASFDGSRMELRRSDSSPVMNYTRTTDTQLQRKRMDLMRCLGYSQGFAQPQAQQYAQMQPPDGVPRNYPVDPRLISPGQGGQPASQGHQPMPQQQGQPQTQPPQAGGNYPPPPDMYQPDRRNEPWIQQPMPQQR